MLGGGGSLIAAAVALTWFLKDAVDKGEIKQLKATVGHVKAHLEYVKEREQTVENTMKQLDNELQELRGKIAAGASTEMLAPATARVDIALESFRSANSELHKSLVVIGGKPAEYEERGDVLVIRVPDGGPALVVPKKPPRNATGRRRTNSLSW
jgi:hypothetical protein